MEQLIAQYGLRLLGLAAAYADRETAEDLVQEVLHRAYRLLCRGRPVTWAWLARAVVLQARSERRRAWWRRVVLTAPDRLPEMAAPPAEPDLLDLVRSLPPPQRDVLLLRYWAGFDLAEIARLLAVPPGTVKSRLARARRLLGRVLADEEELMP